MRAKAAAVAVKVFNTSFLLEFGDDASVCQRVPAGEVPDRHANKLQYGSTKPYDFQRLDNNYATFLALLWIITSDFSSLIAAELQCAAYVRAERE